MNPQAGVLILMVTLTGFAAAQERDLQPLSPEEMAEARVSEGEARDRDEVSKDEIEELQQYLREQQLQEYGTRPPRQDRQQEESGLTPFQRQFRDALIDASEANRPPQ